jgi:trk system potassium uptake protein TrkH
MAAVGGLVAALLFGGHGLAVVPEIAPLPGDLEHSLRQGVFQAVSIVTTTGYASMDFDTWSQPAKAVLFFAFFVGGSVGSAAGSIKIVRWLLLRRAVGRELFTTIHPEAIRPVRLDGASLDEGAVQGVLVFVLAFVAIFALATVVVFIDAVRTGLDLSALEAMSVAIATLGNVGPGFGAVGPMNSFLPFSAPAKLFMVLLMWIGRLEILSVLVVLSPAYWRA